MVGGRRERERGRGEDEEREGRRQKVGRWGRKESRNGGKVK